MLAKSLGSPSLTQGLFLWDGRWPPDVKSCQKPQQNNGIEGEPAQRETVIGATGVLSCKKTPCTHFSETCPAINNLQHFMRSILGAKDN